MANNSKYSFNSLIEFINNNFTLLLLVIIVFGVGFYSGSNWRQDGATSITNNQEVKEDATAPVAERPSGPSKEQLAKVPEITSEDHVQGSDNPEITLIEYSDFECPYCNRFHPTSQKIIEEYGDKVAWVYRHFPLSFHENAQDSAEFSECVAKYVGQEEFWEFSDILFEKMEETYAKAQKEGSNSIDSPAKLEAMVDMANDMGWDGAQLQTCVENDEMKEVVDSMEKGGRAAGVSGTPGTIVKTADGEYELIPGAVSYESLKQTVEGYLN